MLLSFRPPCDKNLALMGAALFALQDETAYQPPRGDCRVALRALRNDSLREPPFPLRVLRVSVVNPSSFPSESSRLRGLRGRLQ